LTQRRKLGTNKPPLVAYGAQAGLTTLEGLRFDPSKPYTGCKLCGAVFQSDYDRHPGNYVDGNLFIDTKMVELYALGLRKEWSQNHARRHSEHEHHMLELSGLWCAPEAAQSLAPLGVIPLTDMVVSEETEEALRESKPVPTDDVEGT
jgi:hypothetical protein